MSTTHASRGSIMVVYPPKINEQGMSLLSNGVLFLLDVQNGAVDTREDPFPGRTTCSRSSPDVPYVRPVASRAGLRATKRGTSDGAQEPERRQHRRGRTGQGAWCSVITEPQARTRACYSVASFGGM